MWAQGLTIALLIAAGALTQTRRAAMAAEVCRIYQYFSFDLQTQLEPSPLQGQTDHSWQDVVCSHFCFSRLRSC
jgi:hypothetical protein